MLSPKVNLVKFFTASGVKLARLRAQVNTLMEMEEVREELIEFRIEATSKVLLALKFPDIDPDQIFSELGIE